MTDSGPGMVHGVQRKKPLNDREDSKPGAHHQDSNGECHFNLCQAGCSNPISLASILLGSAVACYPLLSKANCLKFLL